jgi:hypothetical protein
MKGSVPALQEGQTTKKSENDEIRGHTWFFSCCSNEGRKAPENRKSNFVGAVSN